MQGEHQQQDFKYCISDARKIARTISAFANSDGGKLLIGVRDNGSIAGVSGEEEYYMIESAASLYCKPGVSIKTEVHRSDSKSVLEVSIEKGDKRPYLASQHDGRWLAYIRQGDQNLPANRVILKLWQLQKENSDILVEFTEAELKLIEYLKNNPSISISRFRKLAGITLGKAEWTLARLISIGMLDYEISVDGCNYFPARK